MFVRWLACGLDCGPRACVCSFWVRGCVASERVLFDRVFVFERAFDVCVCARYFFVCFFVCLFFCLFVFCLYLFVCLIVCFFFCLFVCVFVCLFVCCLLASLLRVLACLLASGQACLLALPALPALLALLALLCSLARLLVKLACSLAWLGGALFGCLFVC